ncbi:hypothetical protein [Pedobacter sandarakinus]|uniref:hypothetical protein n=1 Tax=Pedobacter sandarakinus TaxID=353156 RepID=UPI002245C51B|nr:hypothetical protein [Pedobacter sandarakinus]MCX2573662.1 hypothetical protein [Pedobacter sandarakinus]
MKRFEAANPQNDLPVEPQRQLPKNFHRAKKALPLQRSLNDGVEHIYHDLLNRFKKLYQTLPNPLDRTVVEINNKSDATDPDGMHTFITPHFRYHLRCSYADKYEILYQFHNCPFELEIRAWFKRAMHSTYAFESDRIKDFSSFYKGVLAFQPKERISILDYVAP